jgi:hypothetical protein
VYQIAVKYSEWPTFSIKGYRKFTQIGIFGTKKYRLATLHPGSNRGS